MDNSFNINFENQKSKFNDDDMLDRLLLSYENSSEAGRMHSKQASALFHSLESLLAIKVTSGSLSSSG